MRWLTSLVAWLNAHIGRPRGLTDLPDPHERHATTEQSRAARRDITQRNHRIEVQLQALRKEAEVLKDRRGWR